MLAGRRPFDSLQKLLKAEWTVPPEVGLGGTARGRGQRPLESERWSLGLCGEFIKVDQTLPCW